MAVAQGICKNCGSLIVYNTADDVCECIFCNAVFPLAELIPMDAELKDITFPNEKFEKSEDAKHHYVVPVLPDQVQVNVDREKRSKTLDSDTKEKLKYEVTAKDVKAPKSVVLTLAIASVALLAIVVAISLPMYSARTKLLNKMQNNMGAVVSGVVVVDTEIGDDGYSKGYVISGNKCENVQIVTADEVDNEKAVLLYNNYCDKRQEVSSNIKSNSDVEMTIYAKQGIFTVNNGGDVEFKENSVPSTTKK